MKIIRGAGGGGKAGGGDAHTPVEAPDSLHSTAYARIIDAICEGEIGGLVNGGKSIFLDETPLQNADGSYNFKNVQVDSRTGTQDQEPLTGFPEVENETAYGVPLLVATPFVRAITNLELTAVNVRLGTAGLLETSLKNGDTSGYSVLYSFEMSVDGGAYEIIYEGGFTGKTTTTFERSHRIDLPPATVGWSIRVKRLTPESSASNIQDDLQVVAVTEIIDAKLRYSNTALVGIAIDASQFRSIPRRAYEVYLRIVQVPSNYNPVTRVYTGIWDGTFQPLWTDNPAWCYYDMVTNDRFGLGHLVTPLMIDKWSLYEISQYCDGLVDDGQGGTEPRFTCNVYFQSQVDAYKLLQDMASIFRGISFWAGGTIRAMSDRPQDPVYTYTNGNVIKGKFSYSGTSRRTRHTVALVAWSDPADFYRGKIEYVADEEGLTRYGVQETSVTAIGATSQGMAHRMGVWILLSERLLTDSVSFSVGLDGTVAVPGQLINIADSSRAGKRIGGRVKTATTTVITPDVFPTIVAGTYNLTCINPSTGVAEVREVITDGLGPAFTVVVPFTEAPLTDSIWGVANSELEMQLFKIVATVEGDNESDEIQFDLVAIQANQSIFDAVDFGYAVQVPVTSTLPSKVLAPPTNVVISDYEKVVEFISVLQGVISWDEVPGVKYYTVSYRVNNSDWTPPVRVQQNRYEVDNASTGVYMARVSATSHNGVSSKTAYSIETVVSPGTFSNVLEVFSVAGVLTINCALSEQYLVNLTESITSVLFTNVPSQKTVIIEVRNPASWDLTFPPNVVAVSGVTYRPSYPGTAPVPKIDTVGLQTETAGTLWALRADMDDRPSTGGTGGSFTVSVTPLDAYGYAASAPSVAVAAVTAGGTAPITVSWARALGGVGDWGGSTTNVGGADFTCSAPTGLNPTFSRTGGANGYVAQNWQVTAEDATGLLATCLIEVTLEDDGVIIGGGSGPVCVWAESYLADGRKAKDARVGTRTVVIDPITMEHTTARISYARLAFAPCFLLLCENGVELTCSETAPIPTTGGELVLAPLMLGLDTITVDNGVKAWSRVVLVSPLGVRPVMHITCEDKCFLAGNVKNRLMAHHNIKWEPDGPGTGV